MRLKIFAHISFVGMAFAIVVPSAHAITAAGVKRVAEAVGQCGNPCVVVSNNGGLISSFRGAGNAIRSGTGQMLVVDGFCASACMVMADRARPRVCITSRATFAYHKTSWNRRLPLSADLDGWIMRHGSYPEFNGTPGIMPNEVARQFWKQC